MTMNCQNNNNKWHVRPAFCISRNVPPPQKKTAVDSQQGGPPAWEQMSMTLLNTVS